jgi:predicted dehydrogenase
MKATSDLSTEPADTQAPLRIGVIGDSRPAMFHLESAALHVGFTPIAAAIPDDEVPNCESIPGCPFLPVDVLLDRPEVELVFVTGAPDDVIEQSQRVLKSGRHVVLDADADLTSASLEALFDLADSTGCFCNIWRPHQADENWRQAIQVRASTESSPGAVRSVRFLLHDLAASMLPPTGWKSRTVAHSENAYGVLATVGTHRIAQLVELLDGRVVAVRGQLSFRRVKFGSAETAADSESNVDATDSGFLACISFASGATAVVDVSMSCAAPLATGWVMQFERGGFADGQHSITVEDGEIYHVPVPVEPFDPYADLRASIRNEDTARTQARSRATHTQEIRVARIIELIRHSHDTGQVITCDV